MRELIHQHACREHLRSGPLPAAFFGSERGGRSRGFALLLTLIVIGVIGAVAFGVGYLTLHAYQSTVRFQDSQSALEAAEAGIEDGLLRFRYDRNVQVPTAAMCAALPAGSILPVGSTVEPEPTDTTKFVLRVNLTTGQLQCVDPTSSGVPTPDPTQSVYDLKIFFKSQQLGVPGQAKDALAKDQNSPLLGKDETLVMSGLSGTPGVTLQYAFVPGTFQANSSGYQAEIKFLDVSGNQKGDTRIISTPFDIGAITSPDGLTFAPLPDRADQLSLKPLAGSVRLAALALGASATVPIDFGVSFLESTGYANGVKRRLTSAINRKTGSTQGIYNFVLFGASGNLAP